MSNKPATETPSRFSKLIDDLAVQGWAFVDHAIDSGFVDRVMTEVQSLLSRAEFQPARIRGASDVAPEVRGDQIHWIETGRSPVQDEIFRYFEELRLELNRELYLGLEDFEAHFALYPSGSLYARHLDRFRDDNRSGPRRTISLVMYFNRDWQPSHGGELVLYPSCSGAGDVLKLGSAAEPQVGVARPSVVPEAAVKIEPLAGRIVGFKSAEIEHEVLTAHAPRLSLAGWFRTR